LIDITIPYWGEPALLKAAVDSVRAQTSPDWRLTVIDDCYPDPRGGQIFDSIDDPRIVYRRNETNLGVTGNFRQCIAAASADHTVIMGCDDILLPNYVDTLTQATARFPKADIVQPGVVVVDDAGKPAMGLADTVKQRLLAPSDKRPAMLVGEQAAVSLLRGDWLYWPSLVFKTATIQRHDFRDGFPVIQDLALLIDMVLDGASLLYYPTTAFAYRRHRSSASQLAAAAGDRFADEARYYRLASQLMADAGWKRAARTARHRTISRLHAVSLLPGALAARDRGLVRQLRRHVFEGLGRS
jgi:hypothetical protein